MWWQRFRVRGHHLLGAHMPTNGGRLSSGVRTEMYSHFSALLWMFWHSFRSCWIRVSLFQQLRSIWQLYLHAILVLMDWHQALTLLLCTSWRESAGWGLCLRRLHSLCPVCALRTYINRTQGVHLCDQLFVCFANPAKGKALSKQRLSHWIVEAISVAYSSRGPSLPQGVKAHSTRGMVASWALFKGISVSDICAAASWSSPHTFVRFYRLDVTWLTLSFLLGLRCTWSVGGLTPARWLLCWACIHVPQYMCCTE